MAVIVGEYKFELGVSELGEDIERLQRAARTGLAGTDVDGENAV